MELTGGEPLAHPEAPALLAALQGLGYEVALETAGSHDLSVVPPGVVKIVDRKTPGSGEVDRWLESNLAHMVSGQDELKFVLLRPGGLRLGQGLVPRPGTCWGAWTCCSVPCGAAWIPPGWRNGSSRTACRCASSCSCTRSSGGPNGVESERPVV